MTTFSKNLNCFIEDRNMTQKSLAADIGVTPVTVNTWIRQGRLPSIESIMEICDFYGIDYDDLMSDKYGYYARTHHFDTDDYPPGALALETPQPAYAPLYGTVHAGDAQEPFVINDSIPIPYEVWQNHKNGYFLEVQGDCMDKVYPPGCMVLIDPDIEPSSGSIGVVSIDSDDFVMRRLFIGANLIVLSPESHNSSWTDIVVDDTHDVRTVGKVVWFQPSEELQ